MTNYEKQATDFLRKTGATLTAEFKAHGKHFSSDKEERDIYTITIKRGDRSMVFDFGQSLDESGLFWTYAGGKGRMPNRKNVPIPTHIRKDLIKNNQNVGNKYTNPKLTRFFLDIGLPEITWETGKAPRAYDVLACLQCSDVGSFEDFCGCFGYDEDSKTAEATYKAVLKEYTELCTLFNSEEVAEMADIN